ncbi:hypothetical protein Tco_1427950 [Tanacetum coccineum]
MRCGASARRKLVPPSLSYSNDKTQLAEVRKSIEMTVSPVYHSKTKHIEIRHHFIRDCYEKKLISVEKIHTDLNVADLLTKPFDGPRFNYLVVSIGAKGLTSPEQTATGKGISNPLMAVMVCQKPYGIQLTNVSRVNTPGSDENRLKLYDLMYKIVNVADIMDC